MFTQFNQPLKQRSPVANQAALQPFALFDCNHHLWPSHKPKNEKESFFHKYLDITLL